MTFRPRTRLLRALTDWVMRAPVWHSSVAATGLAIAISVISAKSLLNWTGYSDFPLISWVPAVVMVPLILAPVLVSVLVGMAHELDDAKAALAKMALTDPLTGVANRRAFMDQAEIEVARHHRLSAPFAVLMLDIDHFKSVNDNLGHSVGDQVLCAIAAVGGVTLRAGDLFARYGGEEFIALLPATDHRDATLVAENLRAKVAGLDLALLGLQQGTTTSIGVAIFPTHASTLQGLFDEADRQLYLAKHAGRNCVSMKQPEISSKVA